MTRKKENAILIAVTVLLLFIGWFKMVDGPKWAKQELSQALEPIVQIKQHWKILEIKDHSNKYREYQRSQGLRVCEYCNYSPEEYPIPE